MHWLIEVQLIDPSGDRVSTIGPRIVPEVKKSRSVTCCRRHFRSCLLSRFGASPWRSSVGSFGASPSRLSSLLVFLPRRGSCGCPFIAANRCPDGVKTAHHSLCEAQFGELRGPDDAYVKGSIPEGAGGERRVGDHTT